MKEKKEEKVADDDGDSSESIFQYVVVYDPRGGSVTGGGWIDSPKGACTRNPSLTGKVLILDQSSTGGKCSRR